MRVTFALFRVFQANFAQIDVLHKNIFIVSNSSFEKVLQNSSSKMCFEIINVQIPNHKEIAINLFKINSESLPYYAVCEKVSFQ